jgi:hypothetical protein
MSFGNPEPLDPFYVKFRDGFAKWIIEKPQYPGLRWASWSNGGEWAAFKLAEWDFIDFGIIGPKSPLLSDLNIETSPWQYTWRWEKSKNERDLPPVWSEINGVYARYKALRSGAVWNPYDGSWREMRRRPPSSPGPVLGDPPGPLRPEDEFHRKSRQLYQDYRAGIITDEIYKTRLLELHREYF